MIEDRLLTLLQLLEGEEYHSASWLAEQLGISDRTVRSTLTDARAGLGAHGVELQARPRHGYRLLVHDPDAYQRLIAWRENDTAHLNAAPDRIDALLAFILFHNGYFNRSQISRRLYVSLSTVSSLLGAAEDILQTYGMRIERHAQHGMLLVGSERSARRVICARLDVLRSCEAQGQKPSYREMRKLVNELCGQTRIALSTEAFERLVNIACTLIWRASNNHFIEPLDGPPTVLLPDEERLVDELIGMLPDGLPEEQRLNERVWMSTQLEALRPVFKATDDVTRTCKEAAKRYARTCLADISKRFALDLSARDDLLCLLESHIACLLVRITHQIDYTNPSFQRTACEHPHAFSLILETFMRINKDFSCMVSPDEAGHMANLVQYIIESNTVTPKRNVLLIHSMSEGDATLFVYRLRKECGELLGGLTVRLPTQVTNEMARGFDTVLAACRLSPELTVKYHEIDPELPKDQFRQIRQLIERDAMVEVYNRRVGPERFFALDKVTSAKDLIRQAAEIVGVSPEDITPKKTQEARLVNRYGIAYAIARKPTEGVKTYIFVLSAPVMWKWFPVSVLTLPVVGPNGEDVPTDQLELWCDSQLGIAPSWSQNLASNPSYEHLVEMLIAPKG